MNKTKIIVVEDNIVYCEYVCNMLSREGYRNMKAYHLSTAKKHLQQATDNDIVVADLRLPDGSGIDLLCWMRKEGKMQPFIIMTDYAEKRLPFLIFLIISCLLLWVCHWKFHIHGCISTGNCDRS